MTQLLNVLLSDLTKSRKNVSELARELSVQPQLLYKWSMEYDALSEGSFQVMGI